MAALSDSYRPVRRDIAFWAICRKCNQPLRSHTAYFLQSEDEEEHTFGPKCARTVLDEAGISALKSVPDYTAAMSSPEDEEDDAVEPPAPPRSGAAATRRGTDPKKKTVQYLLLRQRVLRHIPQAGYRDFEIYARDYEEKDALSPRAERHIQNTMRKNAGGKYGMRSLLTVHAYDAALAYALSTPKLRDNDFLLSIRGYLHRRLRLTPRQIETAERDLPGGVSLDRDGFFTPERDAPE